MAYYGRALGEVAILALLINVLCIKWLSAWAFSALLGFQMISLYLYLRQNYAVFERLNISSVPHRWIVGNIFSVGQNMHLLDYANMMKYGKVWGSFLGTLPELVVADAEMLRHICIKDFRNFPNRRDVEIPEKEGLFGNMISILKGSDWRTVRNTITPAFTTGKLNKMTPLVNHCMDTLKVKLTEISDGSTQFNVHKLFGSLTMDVISTCALATDVNSMNDPDNELVRMSKKMFDTELYSPIILLLFYFPNLIFKWLPKIGVGFNLPMQKFFTEHLSKLVSDRRQNPVKTPDFLQLMIDAHDYEPDGEADVDHLNYPSYDEVGKNSSDKTWSSAKRKLSDEEIISQSCLFLVAGYHTTAMTLTFCAYTMAMNPEMQQRCFDELCAAMAKRQEEGKNDSSVISFEMVRTHLPYLECVILETLRMYPPASRTERVCNEDCEISGVKIKAGMTVSIPIHAIQHCADYYPEPEKFLPERFEAEERSKRDPLTFLPFGAGPRNCVGMRFALLELKLAMANILLNFRLITCEKTKLEIASAGMLKLVEPLWLGIEKRC